MFSEHKYSEDPTNIHSYVLKSKEHKNIHLLANGNGPNGTRFARCHFRAPKSLRAHPSKGICSHQNQHVPRHINIRYLRLIAVILSLSSLGKPAVIFSSFNTKTECEKIFFPYAKVNLLGAVKSKRVILNNKFYISQRLSS
jgi:hypothetical protein